LLALVVAGVALALVASRARVPAAAPDAGERIVVFDTGQEPWPRGYEALATARSARSIPALAAELKAGADLVVLGPGTTRDLQDDEFAGVANQGIAIMGIETPLPEVWRVGGALNALRRANPGFAADEVQRRACAGCHGFLTYAWHSCPSDELQQSSNGQRDLAHSRFDAVLRDVLSNTRGCPVQVGASN
jgi:hypothetical protein